MKGDISRETFDATKHYSGVRMQQGRVQTDADWNEQEALQRRRTRVEARDVIGPCGAPEDDAGFGITIAPSGLRIGAGRYYVDGILCENEVEGLQYDAQPDLPSATAFADELAKLKASAAIVYLDVWERHITPLDDPLLREVALGGPDTATRVKTVWQVRLLPVEVGGSPAERKRLVALRAKVQEKLDKAIASGVPEAQLADVRKELAEIDAKLAAFATPSCETPFKEWAEVTADTERRLNARTQPPAPASGPCVVPPTSGYRRLENQLYRVEVHTPGPLGTATFKWSRDNGTVVTSIEKISGKEITVHDLGPDDVLGFAAGQWVELTDDVLELQGLPGQLAQIDAINASLRRITLKVAPTPLASGSTGVNRAMHPKLRRWDQSGLTATASGVATAAAWLPLEDGIDVQFSASVFRSGDYWMIPARTATGEIEWPPFANPNSAPIAQLPRGIQHRYCRLALLSLDEEKKIWSVVDDCRHIFPPLTKPCCSGEAAHVVATSWDNDDLFPISTLTKDGLRIRLDRAPDPASLSSETVLVSMYAPVPETLGFHNVYLEGTVTRDPADDKVIVWMPPREELGGGGRIVGPNQVVVAAKPSKSKAASAKTAKTAKATVAAKASAAERAAPQGSIRVNVTLKGRLIWSDPRDGKRVFLDGQAFGEPGVRKSSRSARIALTFPSGSKASGSDFESWFFAGREKTKAPLQATSVRFLNAAGAVAGVGTVALPLPRGSIVALKRTEEVAITEITFNRDIQQDSIGPNAPTVFIDRAVAGSNERSRLPTTITVTGNVVRLTLPATRPFPAAEFALNALGTSPPGSQNIMVKAMDDGSALDGDFNDVAGGDLFMPFVVT
jgi:hypothetical protein